VRPVVVLLLAGATCSAWASRAPAAPQGHAAIAAGVAVLDRTERRGGFPEFSGAVRGELFFGRERDKDLGLGPLVTLSSVSFEHYGASAGLSALLPASPTFPFIASLAGGVLSTRPGWSPSVEAWLFWGPASYNFHARYAMASGVLFGYQTSLGSERVTVISVNGQLDLELVALPFILVHQWIAGGDE